MAKMYFANTVRYKGTRYYANTTFEVEDKDVADLKVAGGWVVEPSIPVRLVEEASVEVIDEVADPSLDEEVAKPAPKKSRKPKEE